MDTLVKGAAGQVPAIWAEGHAVDGLLVAGQSVDAHAPLHVPQAHCWVKRRTAERGEQERMQRVMCQEPCARYKIHCVSGMTAT